MWHFKFLPERWGLSGEAGGAAGAGGVTRDLFLKALRAEGVQVGTGHTQPLYQNPLFLKMGYSGVLCPETERIHTTEAVSLGHRLFLGSEDDMQAILEAIQKVWEHREALARL
jgi:dTDP-4-amino-4,6-dideoxygalactose transaminase